MKTNNNIVSPCLIAVMKNLLKSTGRCLPLLVAVLMIFFVPFNVMAARERFVLDFDDSQIRGHRGEAATIFLKKSLKNQYPWLDLSDKDLHRVVLVAKSKRGRGGASLRVGDRMTGMSEVAGRPGTFKNYRRYTFDRVQLRNPSSDSRGPWQIDLKGNFIVRKVVLEMDDLSWRRHNKRWRNHKK
jgi:hypothetical protein